MASKFSYYLLQLLTFCLMSLLAVLSISALHPEALKELEGFANAFSGALTFVLFTHFVIRFGYKRWQHRFQRKLGKYVFILALSFLAANLNAWVKLPKFETKAMNQELEVMVKSEAGLSEMDKSQAKSLEISTNTVLYLLWSLFYLLITGRRNEKVMLAQLQKQQLENLMAQLNPHFLFNSMNTIRALIYEDPDKAADVVTQLSELFRYNLSSGTKAAVTLKEELDICMRYLDIEKNRLGDRIQTEVHVCTELGQIKLPGMALFTLVENAVKHGIAPIPGGGKIQINATRDGNECVLSVANPYLDSADLSGTQIGLANLTQRLEIMFGAAAKLTTRKRDSKFVAEVKVPCDA